VGEPVPPRPVPAPATDNVLALVARDVIAEVNRVRTSRGLAPLVVDTALNRAAREHAAELAERRILDHSSVDPARRTLAMRMQAAGGPWLRAAENLANTSGGAADVGARSARVWMGSDGHRQNMLEPDYTHTGAGVAIDTRGYWYIAQLYAAPRKQRR
jgi:uncharacterized protein YkwD